MGAARSLTGLGASRDPPARRDNRRAAVYVPRQHARCRQGRSHVEPTLSSLGGPIEMHAPPFHFIMGNDGPEPCEPQADVENVYDAALRHIMLVNPLLPVVSGEAIAAAVRELNVESLIFLKSIAAVDDVNRSFASHGCTTCVYYLFRMVAGNSSTSNYMMTADWPGRDAYVRMHASAAYAAASRRNPILSDLSRAEFYGRYVQMK